MSITLIDTAPKRAVNSNDHLNGNPFLLNCWYVGAWSHEVQDEIILARQLLSKRVVFFRDEAGAVSAFEDRCSHRFAPLSIGRHTGNGVRCIYHGLVFNGKGTCIEEPGVKGVSRGTDIKAFPTAERDAFVWIWMGDPELADESLISDCTFQSQPGKWDWEPRYRYFDADYRLIVDNLLDFSHLIFVHENTLGGSTKITKIKPKTESYEKGVHITRWYLDEEKNAPYLRGFETFEGSIDRWNIYDMETKGNVFNMDSGTAPAGSGAPEGVFVPEAMLFHATQIIVDKNSDKRFAYIHFDRGLSAGRKALADALAKDAEYFSSKGRGAQ